MVRLSGGAITGSTRVIALADVWMEAEHGWSNGTQRTYRSVVNKQIKPAFGQLCVREVSPGVVTRALTAIAKNSGSGAAKSARACLSGMFSVAIEDGAIAANPVRDSNARISASKRAPRALTVAEMSRLRELFRSSDRANGLDLPDLVDWMLATGCRIGEALALRYGTNGDGKPLLDLDARTWEVNATVVRVRAPRAAGAQRRSGGVGGQDAPGIRHGRAHAPLGGPQTRGRAAASGRRGTEGSDDEAPRPRTARDGRNAVTSSATGRPARQ
jgi:Phage integrase, N-terminal SAM-like domain